MTNHRPKLAILATHAIQHFVPVYQRLVEDYDVELKVFYIAENGVKDSKDSGFSTSFSWDIPLLEGYEYEFLNPGFTVNHFGFREVDAKNVNSKIASYKPDFIWINGYWAMANWRALFGKRSNQKVIYSSDSNLLDQRSGLRLMAKHLIVKTFISKCDHFISVSEQNTRYLEHYGANPEAIETASYPIDMRRFTRARDSFTAADRENLRQRYGLSKGHFVILFSGKLIDYKRPKDLVDALNRLIELNKGDDIVIMLMGDGPQKAEIELYISDLGLDARVIITGFINQTEIPLHLFAADVFALTSEKEPFGAVVSEALPFGLPIIAADKIGAVGDMASAQPNKNAIVYPWGDIQQLSQAMLTLYSDKDKYNKFRDHSFSLVEQNDTKVYCEAIMRCLDKSK